MLRDGTKKAIWGISIAVIVFFLIVIAGIFMGFEGIGKILLFVLGGVIFLGLIGVVIYVIYYLFFKKHKFDATYMNKKNLISAGRISKPNNINDLYLSGDKGHSRVRVGKIIGYCRIQTVRKLTEYDEKTGQPKVIRSQADPNIAYEQTTIEKEEEDIFVVQTNGWLMSLFSEPIVIRVRTDAHDDLVGDVTLWGFSLLPISEYYYLNDEYIDVQKIDTSILLESKRTIAFEMLKDFKEITDKAIGLDSSHKKNIENKQLYEIPNMPNQQGGNQ